MVIQKLFTMVLIVTLLATICNTAIADVEVPVIVPIAGILSATMFNALVTSSLVYGTGKLTGGTGSFKSTLLGGTLGAFIGTTISMIHQEATDYETSPILDIFVIPIASSGSFATIFYVSSMRERQNEQNATSLLLSSLSMKRTTNFSNAIERLRQTVNPKALQLHLGHSSALMTMRYLATLTPEDALRIQQQVSTTTMVRSGCRLREPS